MDSRECTLGDGDTIEEILVKESCTCWSCVEYQEWANASMDRQDAKKLAIESGTHFLQIREYLTMESCRGSIYASCLPLIR